MSTAGKIVLLVPLIFFGSGALSQLHAQEKITPLPILVPQNSTSCTSLNNYLVTEDSTCTNTKLSQVEVAVKAQAQTNFDSENEFSYSLESAYYVPPPTTPTPTIASPTPIQPTETVAVTAQTPQDMVPAEGPNLNSDMIFDMINQHRASIGKPPFQKDEALCSLAQTRATELHGELFEGKGALHSGLYNRNLPYWITEDAKWGSNEAGTVDWWLHSPIHRAAIEGDYTYSCGACQGSQCSQLFTSYTPKASVNLSPTPLAPTQN
jgi:uncharacterized protein YkwD